MCLPCECAHRTVEKEPSPNILPNRKSSGLFLRGWGGWGGATCPSMLLPWRRGVSCWPLTMDGQEMRTEEWRDATSYWREREREADVNMSDVMPACMMSLLVSAMTSLTVESKQPNPSRKKCYVDGLSINILDSRRWSTGCLLYYKVNKQIHGLLPYSY